MERDEIITLPSGTELDVASALGDLSRAIEALSSVAEPWATDYAQGIMADLGHVKELIEWMAPRVLSPDMVDELADRLASKVAESLQAKSRLEYLRQELRYERISYDELAELQSLVEYIDPSDVELLEAAGVPEHGEPDGD